MVRVDYSASVRKQLKENRYRVCMSNKYEKSWKQSMFKERNDKIRRLHSEGMTISILSKRFGLSWEQVKTILKERIKDHI